MREGVVVVFVNVSISGATVAVNGRACETSALVVCNRELILDVAPDMFTVKVVDSLEVDGADGRQQGGGRLLSLLSPLVVEGCGR